jgi:predicted NBD/HSP70 family sugar kinase/putative N-acetylmannosamine-6-phosphate epimerase
VIAKNYKTSYTLVALRGPCKRCLGVSLAAKLLNSHHKTPKKELPWFGKNVSQTREEFHPPMEPSLFDRLRAGLVVSCQPDADEPGDDPLNRPEFMAGMAQAAVAGGACAIRADSPAHIAAIRAVVAVPVIGIYKVDLPGYAVRITPTLEHAAQISRAGADILAVDATARPRPQGASAAGYIRLLIESINKPVLADVATFEEGLAAAEAGAAAVATTLSGYTSYSPRRFDPDFNLLEQLVKALSIPVIAEGRFNTPSLAAQAIQRGAWAVTVGSAITLVCARDEAPSFPEGSQTGRPQMIGAIDVGGTKIAVGLVDSLGQVISHVEAPSAGLMSYASALAYFAGELRRLSRQAGTDLQGVGIGLTGRVDHRSGLLTENEFFPDWSGRDLAGDLSRKLGLGVAMENDADAAALAEARWGAGRGYRIFLYVTVSTGIGGGLVIDGRLYRGTQGWHPEIGHQVVSEQATTCYCGASGCWEQMACGPALADGYHRQGGALLTAAEICDLARRGDDAAQRAVARTGYWLGIGLANLITLFAPECIALGGGVMRSWDLFEPQVRSVIEKHCSFLVPHQMVDLLPARLGSSAPLAGAACVWLHANE